MNKRDAPATKQIAAMNVAPDSALIAESGSKAEVQKKKGGLLSRPCIKTIDCYDFL